MLNKNQYQNKVRMRLLLIISTVLIYSIPYNRFDPMLFEVIGHNITIIIPPITIHEIPQQSIIDIRIIRWNNTPPIKNHTFIIKEDFPFLNRAKFYQDFVNSNRNQIFHLRNCLVSGNTALIYNDSVIVMTDVKESIVYLYEAQPGNCVGEYDIVIATGHRCGSIFGHFIEDALSPLMQMPNEVLKNAKIVLYTEQKFLNDFMPRLGFGNQTILLQPNEWVYAREIYINLSPRNYMKHVGPCFKKFSEFVRDKFGLLHVVPDKYLITNRNHSFRKIGNFDELVSAVKTAFPNITWDVCIHGSEDIEKTIKLFAYSKIIYGPQGSNFFNCVFLHPTSVCILVQSDLFDVSTPATISCRIVKIILYCEPQMLQFKESPNIFNISKAILAFKVAIHALEYNKWPNIPNGDLFI